MNHPIPMRMTVSMIVLLLSNLAVAQTQIKPGFNLFSQQDDVQIGAASAAQAEQQLPMLNDAVVTQYVDAIGQRLAKNAGGPPFQYQFHVVNAPDINAFALPGGFVFINRGVLDSARNEGEVAGVIAHEISHVSLRHGTHQASKAYLAQSGLSILGALLGGRMSQGASDIIGQLGGLGLNVLFLKYTREIETEADVRGSQILAASGYAPQDMINFFQTLAKADPSKKTNFLADHPAPPDRIARIQKEAAMLQASSSPTENVARLRQIQARLASAGAAPAPGRQRTGSGGAPAPAVQVQPPSRTLRTFVSPSRLYQIAYPENWQVATQGDTGVRFAPEGGTGTVNGRTEIAYGAIVDRYKPFSSTPQSSLQTPSRSQSATLVDASNDLIRQLQHDSPYLRTVSGSAQRLTLSGGDALAVALSGKHPNTGLQERVTVITRQLVVGSGGLGAGGVSDGDLVYILFVTPERDAAAYQGLLEEMANSIVINDRQGR